MINCSVREKKEKGGGKEAFRDAVLKNISFFFLSHVKVMNEDNSVNDEVVHVSWGSLEAPWL